MLSGCSDDAAPDRSSQLDLPAEAAPPAQPNGTDFLPPVNETLPALPFDFVGTGCREFLALMQVPVDNVRTFVPDNITILADALGETVFFAGVKSCDDVSLDGAPGAPGMISDVGVLIEAPDGSGGNHYYQLWMVSDHEAFVRGHEALGVWSGLAPTNYSEVEAGPGVAEVDWQVGWLEGSYRADGTAGGVAGAPATDFTGWHWGPQGLFRIQKSFTYTHYAGGESEIVAVAGSPMQTLLGAVFKDGLALHNHYDHSGRAELVGL